MEINNKAVLITGASSGVGAALARQLAVHGAKVGVNYCRSEQGAKQVCADIAASGGEAFAIQGDVGSEDDCARMVSTIIERFGSGIVCLVHDHRADLPAVRLNGSGTLEHRGIGGDDDPLAEKLLTSTVELTDLV